MLTASATSKTSSLIFSSIAANAALLTEKHDSVFPSSDNNTQWHSFIEKITNAVINGWEIILKKLCVCVCASGVGVHV